MFESLKTTLSIEVQTKSRIYRVTGSSFTLCQEIASFLEIAC